LTFLADSLCKSGTTLEAEQTARAALKINTTRLGKDHPRAKESEGALGCALLKRNRFTEAEPFLLSYAAALQSNVGTEGDLGEVVKQIVGMYTAWGKPDKAAEWRKKLLPEPKK
jgi:hypothetical protein